MRPIDSAIELAYISNPYRVTAFHLCEIVGSVMTYRYTDAPIPVIWGGQVWANVYFTLSEIVADADGELTCTISFEDASKTLRAVAFNEDLQDRTVRVTEVWANSSNTLFGEDIVIHGMADGLRAEEDTEHPTATLQVHGLFASSNNVIGPTQDYTRNCRYQEFKGAQCKYAGAATFCDRSYATCSTLGNTINFGGFRFALDAGETVSWVLAEPQVETPRWYPPYTPPPPETGEPTVVQPNRRRAVGRG